MTLYHINAMGIQAYCSDLIVDPNDSETVYYMSIGGYQATVKGIIANLLDNYGINIEVDGNKHYLTRGNFGYKAQLKKLPSERVHAVLFPRLALPKSDDENQDSFFIMTDERDKVLTLFFRHLDEKTDIPLHPSWARWLWKAFENQEGWLLEAKTMVGSFEGYLFEFNQQNLHDLVSEAIRKRIPEVIDCMKWKGGKVSGKSNIA